ncbi:zinc finger protein 277-like [Plectropomus leopardus]|uniref:zinc finger protein 277-like n=1 Tax=Plectropomus leopardus TaxID=160734 RepID=UPI001C4A7F56|nr:zinc finger protein 277-like [Plectropomus leopardus]
MFCSDEFTGNRSSLLNHMAREHSFSIGLPDNIVYCNQFLDTLQSKLDNLQCLYCEKTFRDKTTLKDHMRKKTHRRINANNREYDRFYVINYLVKPQNYKTYNPRNVLKSEKNPNIREISLKKTLKDVLKS